MKLKQIKCPNCGANLATRKFVQDGWQEDCNGVRYRLYKIQRIIKCKFCRSEFEQEEK